MAGEKEIRGQIASIKSTQKITSAMELIAASKMKKTQELMLRSREYATKILQISGHVACSESGKKNIFIKTRETKNIGYIIVSSDKGLCGGLNSILFKKTIDDIMSWKKKGVSAEFFLIGKKAASFFQNIKGANIISAITHIGETPKVADLIGSVQTIINSFKDSEIDQIYLVYNNFVNSIIQKPVIKQLLPLVPSKEIQAYNYSWDYIYEVDPGYLLDNLITRYLESQVYQAMVENNACEQASRMVAMKNATDNAADIIDELQLIYNKARQAAITQELSEIISGASAV